VFKADFYGFDYLKKPKYYKCAIGEILFTKEKNINGIRIK
jgi:hypothetical protein